MNAKTVLRYAAEQGAKFVSVRFTDLPGAWHHLTFPIEHLTEDSFEDGFGFDASSLRGWAAINESDMLLVPDPSRCWVDPFAEEATVCLIANAVDPITKEGYGLDPRTVAVRAENYLKFTGLADTTIKIQRVIRLNQKKLIGVPVEKAILRIRIWVTTFVRKKATFLLPRLILWLTYATRFRLFCKVLESMLNVITMKLRPRDNAKLISNFQIFCIQPII
jgi:Glutamine synthetase, beta-Grasp domain